jgi:transketolase
MRKQLAKLLLNEMQSNPNIYLITGDLGYGLWDDIMNTFPDRFFNVGSSEMAMMGMAIGLAMDNKIPFVYSITPFAIYRPFEMIRNYIDHENIPVKILGGGRNEDYGYLGFSHWASEDIAALNVFENLTKFKPNTQEELENAFAFAMNENKPTYINLKK